MLMETPFFRVRWTLHARSSWLLRSHQDAILYALLCDAARGDATDRPMRIPEGLLLDAPERCRDRYQKGDSFAFGATLIETDHFRATRFLHEISAGLIRVGRDRPRTPVALGGNFDLIDVQDLVARKSLSPGDAFTPLGLDAITAEIERLIARVRRAADVAVPQPVATRTPRN